MFLSQFLPGVWVTIESDSGLDFVEVIVGLPECRSAQRAPGLLRRERDRAWEAREQTGVRSPAMGGNLCLGREPPKRTGVRTSANSESLAMAAPAREMAR